jgi:DNA-binding NarL/FixJ family response regulator
MVSDNPEKIKVLLADDHVIVREGTRDMISRQPDMEVVGEASDGSEAVKLVKSEGPDVVVMDISMPNMNGIEATAEIKKCCPNIAVLVLTAYDTDQYVMALLEAGAAGYLLKNVRSNQLIDAIRAVYIGESVLPPDTTRHIIDQLTSKHGVAGRPAGTVTPLTDRELEVLKLAAKGEGNKDIAEILDLSDRTVQTHLSNIFKKLAVASRTEAILHGLRKGWFQMEDLP